MHAARTIGLINNKFQQRI